MLISFTVKNMFSFKDENTLDMRASGIKAHSYSLINEGAHKLLPVTAIYGANASGKTNLIRTLEGALQCIAGQKISVVPFLFDKSTEAPSYKICFAVKTGEAVITYEFSFSFSANEISSEELYCIPPDKKTSSLIYSREWDVKNEKWKFIKGTSKFSKQFSKEIEYVNEMELNRDVLLLTALGKRALGERAHLPWFKDILAWALNASLYDEPYTSKMGTPIFYEGDEIVSVINDNNNLKSLNSFIHMLNPIINGISLEDMPSAAISSLKGDNDYNIKKYLPVFKYDILEESRKNFVGLVTNFESKGVWTAIHLFPQLHRVLNHGGLLIVDELENSQHPLLMVKIINLFTSPETNPGHGQLIFTTHNALIMSKKYFRQDEIVFVEKDEDGASSIYRLSDIEGVRSDLDFCKNYILGAFGAVPDFPETEEGDAI